MSQAPPYEIGITLTSTGDLDISPDQKVCEISKSNTVKWTCDDTDDWLVVFGPNAPVNPKVAGAGRDTLTLTAGRPGDFADVKYTLVIWTGKKLRDVDPKLIVKP